MTVLGKDRNGREVKKGDTIQCGITGFRIKVDRFNHWREFASDSLPASGRNAIRACDALLLVEAGARPKETATTYAVCPECKTLHIGFVGKAIVCAHQTSAGYTQQVIEPQIASRVSDTGWRFEWEAPANTPDPDFSWSQVPPKPPALATDDPYWSAPYPKRGMTETTVTPRKGDE